MAAKLKETELDREVNRVLEDFANIRYTHALDALGKRRSINEQDASRPFSCGDCEGEMIAKRGSKRRWHYAHKAQDVCEPRPDPDNALHRYAQDIIINSFQRHQKDGGDYPFGVACKGADYFYDDSPHTHLGKEYVDGVEPRIYESERLSSCDEIVVKNVALPGAAIYKEKELVPNTRSDLVIETSGGRFIIVEIVNTHPPEEQTRELYRESGHPILIKKVSWDTLDDLYAKFVADKTINIGHLRCGQCATMQRDAEQRTAKHQAYLERLKEEVDGFVGRLIRHQKPTPQFRPWYQVFKHSWTLRNRPVQMYPKTQYLVFANAIILTEMGFKQSNLQKPHLFRYPYSMSPDPQIVLYADLGGSDIVPIYRDTAAMLYVFGVDDQPELQQHIITKFGEALQAEGVQVRTGFESSAYFDGNEVDPTLHVSKAMLNRMVRWST